MNTSEKIKTHRSPGNDSIMGLRQTALTNTYRNTPEQAWVIDIGSTGDGRTNITDPLHTDVKVANVNIPIGVHPAVGGDGDGPVPGEILSAALAACMDSTIRIIANRLAITLTHLEVVVSAEIDVRGTLRLSQSVPVGFQKMHLSIDIKTASGTPLGMLSVLLKAAETSCVVMQTLKNPPVITTQINANEE